MAPHNKLMRGKLSLQKQKQNPRQQQQQRAKKACCCCCCCDSQAYRQMLNTVQSTAIDATAYSSKHPQQQNFQGKRGPSPSNYSLLQFPKAHCMLCNRQENLIDTTP